MLDRIRLPREGAPLKYHGRPSEAAGDARQADYCGGVLCLPFKGAVQA
jgi:hypothetical protein